MWMLCHLTYLWKNLRFTVHIMPIMPISTVYTAKKKTFHPASLVTWSWCLVIVLDMYWRWWYCSCHENIKFVSSRHRVISSIYIQYWGSPRRVRFMHFIYLPAFWSDLFFSWIHVRVIVILNDRLAYVKGKQNLFHRTSGVSDTK